LRIVNDDLIPNDDGIDICNCRNVRISDCYVKAGDDAIVIKAMPNRRGGEAKTCENVTVTGCILESCSFALNIGCEAKAVMRDMVFDDIIIRSSHRGAGIHLSHGCDVENVIFSNMIIETRIFHPAWWGRGEPIYVVAIPWTTEDTIGVVRRVIFSNIICRSESSFYLSLDTVVLPDTLFNFAQELSGRGVTLLLLDEVHYLPRFTEEIKKIFDFIKIKVVFTSSSALSMHSTTVDLSRRVRTTRVPSLSFREMLHFTCDDPVAPLTMDMLMDADASRAYYGRVLRHEPLFDRYLQGKNFPFALDVDSPLSLFRNILDTIIGKDLVLTGRISAEEALDVRRVLSFMGKSHLDGTNYSSLSRNCGITKYKAEKFVDALEQAFVLIRIYPRGAGVTREPKIVMCPPYRLLYKPYDDCIGGIREDFFVDMMTRSSGELHYLKSLRGGKTPDYLCDQAVFEIGGIHKTADQFKGVVCDRKIILTQPGTVDHLKRPLFFAGML